jgi:hypothetical protein
LSGKPFKIDCHPNYVAENDNRTFKKSFIDKHGPLSVDEDLFSSIKSNYKVLIRGKNLFSAILRFLSHTDRSSKYSRENFIELCLFHGDKAKLDLIVNNLRNIIDL